MSDDSPPVFDDDNLTAKEKFFERFRKQLENEMIKKQTDLQEVTQKRFHDFAVTEYAKSNIKVKIDSYENFSRKEIEQKEMILKELTKKLQERLTSFEHERDNQKLLLKEEEQKKVIREDINQIVTKNLKSDSDDFLKIISEKINMNVIPVLTTVNQILDTGIVDESKREQLKTIKTNIFEFLDDTSQIAECQRLIQGDKSIHKISVSIKKIFDRILENQKNLVDKKEIKIIFENNNVEIVFCDEDKMYFVLNNLIKNSINSCDKNGEIKIIINQNQNGVTTIMIVDNGKGFAPKLLDEIFSSEKIVDPFAKENEIKTGMMMSRIIVSNHKGEFMALSQPGKTEVSFTLPPAISFTTHPK